MPFPELRPQSDLKFNIRRHRPGLGLPLVEAGLFIAMIAGLSYLGS